MADIRAAEVLLEAIEAAKIKLQTAEKQYQDAQQLLDRCKALCAPFCSNA
jgi:exonuclease VII small subunit